MSRKIRKHLSASGLFELVRQGFSKVKESRTGKERISLVDTLMSGFAIPIEAGEALFSLKEPSLLAFDEYREEPKNLHTVYGIEQIPCDRQTRTILDDVEPESLRGVYKDVFRQLQRGKVLEE